MSYNTRNIKNTCLLLRNHSKLTKTVPPFDMCSAKLGVLQNAIRRSIEPVILINKTVNNIFEGVFFSKVASWRPATLLKTTSPQDF